MKNQLLKLSVVAFAFSFTASANHDTKIPAMSGNFMGGIGHSWSPGGAQMFVDGLHLKNRFEVSPKLNVVLHNAFALNSANTGAAAAGFTAQNGSTYFSQATITGGSLSFSNLAAYIEHECSKSMKIAFGHMRTGFGMESMWDRVDMGSYWYSVGYGLTTRNGMGYDMAARFTFMDVLPGALEVSLIDGRAARAGNSFGSFGLRWHNDFKNGETTITPVISALVQNFVGGPKDLAFSGGAAMKFAALWLNAEFQYISSETNAILAAGGKNTYWQIMAEPGMDLGMFDLSVKYQFINGKVGAGANNSDHVIGAAIGKTYDDKHTMKLAYQHSFLSKKFAAAPTNDIRLLISTKW